MPALSIRGVTLDYSIYSVRAQSLRSAVTNMAVGGRLLRGPSDVTVVRALNNVSFKLSEGDRLGLVGHNGSGKTSLLKVLAGIYEPTRGEVHVDGRVMSMIAMGAGLDAEATGIQNIRNLALMQMMSNREIERRMPAIIDFCELGAFIHMPVKTYSAGMQARLAFAAATSVEADVLLMDEWIAVGDADFQKMAHKRLLKLVERAGILVLASHDHDLLRLYCNKVMRMEGGVASAVTDIRKMNELLAA